MSPSVTSTHLDGVVLKHVSLDESGAPFVERADAQHMPPAPNSEPSPDTSQRAEEVDVELTWADVEAAHEARAGNGDEPASPEEPVDQDIPLTPRGPSPL